MDLNENQRAVLRKIRHLGYERFFKPIFEQYGVESPENWAAFTEFVNGTQNQVLVEALFQKAEHIDRLGKPSVTLYGCAPIEFDPEQVGAAIRETEGQRIPLALDGFDATQYAVQTVLTVEGSLYITVAFSAQPQVIRTWEGLETVTPVQEMVLRYRPGAYYVAIVGREQYAEEIARSVATGFGLPILNDVVEPNKRWFTQILNGIPDSTVRSMSGSTNNSAAKRFSLGAGQLDDVRNATRQKIDDIDLEVEGNRTRGDVSLMRVTFPVNGQLITISLNLENNSIVSYNFMDMAVLEALLIRLGQVLLAEDAA